VFLLFIDSCHHYGMGMFGFCSMSYEYGGKEHNTTFFCERCAFGELAEHLAARAVPIVY
jgi:hypothetical protein